LFHRDDTVELGVADDVPTLTTEEEDDGMSATAAASVPSPGAEEKTPAPPRRCKRGSKRGRTKAKEQEDYADTDEDESDFEPELSKKKKPATKRKVRPPARAAASRPSQPRPTGKGRAASSTTSVSAPLTLVYKKKTPLTRKAVYVTGRPDKFRNKSIVQDIAKKMGATLANRGSGKVEILFVLPIAPGKADKGTRKACANATERSEDYFIESACKAVTNFPPGSTEDEQLSLLIQDVSTQPSSSLTGQTVSPHIV